MPPPPYFRWQDLQTGSRATLENPSDGAAGFDHDFE